MSDTSGSHIAVWGLVRPEHARPLAQVGRRKEMLAFGGRLATDCICGRKQETDEVQATRRRPVSIGCKNPSARIHDAANLTHVITASCVR